MVGFTCIIRPHRDVQASILYYSQAKRASYTIFPINVCQENDASTQKASLIQEETIFILFKKATYSQVIVFSRRSYFSNPIEL